MWYNLNVNQIFTHLQFNFYTMKVTGYKVVNFEMYLETIREFDNHDEVALEKGYIVKIS